MLNLRSTLLALSLVACGGDDDSGNGGSIALSNLGTTIGTEYCAKTFDCCTAAEIADMFDGAPFTDEAGCVQFYTGFFMQLSSMYQASIDSGKLTYDGAAASQCVSAMRAMTCTDFARADDPLATECPDPFQGNVANGTQCAYDEECVSGYCEGDVQFGMPKPGTCKDLPTSGQQCVDFTCADGLQCQNGTCMALKPDGASCYDGDECMSAGCNGASGSTAGTCGAPMTCNGL
jgi:hypothetical protein